MRHVMRLLPLALTIGLLGTSAGLAQDKGDKKSTDIQVWAIRATTKNKDISPELKRIAEELKKQFKFTGFKLEKSATGSVAGYTVRYRVARGLAQALSGAAFAFSL